MCLLNRRHIKRLFWRGRTVTEVIDKHKQIKKTYNNFLKAKEVNAKAGTAMAKKRGKNVKKLKACSMHECNWI